MALQKLVAAFAVMIVLTGIGCHSQQPECGNAALNTKIIGGEFAAPGSWPWQILLTDDGFPFCGGSLITNQWVLTAAHCMVSGNLNVKVHLGVHNISDFNSNEVVRSLEQITCHPGYNSATYDNDVCLLKLAAPVSFTDYIQPICLASETSTFYDGITAWVTGFGLTNQSDSGSASDTLKEVDVPIVGNNRCNCFSQGFAHITDNMMCAGITTGGKDSCQGDSGGPIVVKNHFSWVQCGVVSFGYGCGLPDYPGVYARVSQYQTWISDIVTGMSPGFVPFNSMGINSDASFICPTTVPHTPPSTTVPHTPPSTTDDDSMFGGGENLSHFTHFAALSLLALFLHVFVGSGRI